MGLSTPILASAAGDCTEAQTACLAMPDGRRAPTGEPEVPPQVFDLVDVLRAHLAVPQRRTSTIRRSSPASGSSTPPAAPPATSPKYVTRRGNEVGALDFQLIWPYTDLLLHDMGEGLADNRPEGVADGREWRTPPLWGIGLTAEVSGHDELLHDGRARSVLEAILWHGGEAAPARDRIVALPASERDALVSFVNSL